MIARARSFLEQLAIPEARSRSVVVFFAFRLPWLLAVGLLARCFKPFGSALSMQPLDGPTWAQQWLRWDSGWYVRIIRDGYVASDCGNHGQVCEQASIAFLPAYPLSVRSLMNLGLSLSVTSFVLNAVLLMFALWGLRRLASRLLSEDAATRVGWCVLAFPTTLFYSAGYAEALFLSCAVWAFVFILDNRALPAALLLSVAALSRPYGIVFAACFLLGCVVRKRMRTGWCSGVAFAISYGAYIAWQGVKFGDPLAFFHARRAWGFKASAYETLSKFAVDTFSGEYWFPGIQDYLGVALALAAAFWCYRKLGVDFALFCLLIAVVPLSQGQVWGMSRGALGAFPIFLMLTAIAPKWRRLAFATGMVLGTINALHFVIGYFVA